MNLRIGFARFLLRLGKFIESTAVLAMKPDDLVEFSRQSYATTEDVQAWGVDDLVDSGLSENERNLLSAVRDTSGKLLLLGVGGGREAIPLARMGFQVTGIDFVPAMVEMAKQNASKRGIQIHGLVQEISQLDVPAESFDVVWLSRSMYSCVPTRSRRVEMIRRIKQALKPGGFFLCQFHWSATPIQSSRGRFLRRLIAGAMGNLAYEDGDSLWLNVEFIHVFVSEDAVRSEIEEGGLKVIHIRTDQTRLGSAACQKPIATHQDRNL